MALNLADDCLILGQRLGEWAARAPSLEEDVALLNLSLDLVGTARSLYSGIGDEDELAYRRDEAEWTNALICELPNGDFGQTMARQLIVSAFQVLLWESLLDDAVVGGVAGKAVKEATYHLDHARTWVVRLGDGTPESHYRMQAGLNAVWPYAFELFEQHPLLLEPWLQSVGAVLSEATLEIPESDWRPTGGRHGRHTEAFGFLLAELQHLHRSHPGATW